MAAEGLVNQPDPRMVRKVTAGGLGAMAYGGSFSVVLFWALETKFQMAAPAPVVAAAGSIIGGAFSLITGYMARERARDA